MSQKAAESREFDAESFLAIKSAPVQVERVDLPEVGGHVYVRAMTAGERDSFEASFADVNSKGEVRPSLANFRSKLAVRTICDAGGKRLFRDHDVEKLADMPAKLIARIATKAGEISNISDEDVDELTGKSGETSDGDSDSG
jgi:hypothetical protein